MELEVLSPFYTSTDSLDWGGGGALRLQNGLTPPKTSWIEETFLGGLLWLDAEDTLLHFIYVSGGEAEGSCSQRRFLLSVWFTLLKHRAGTSWLFIPAQSREIDEGPGSVIKEFMHDVTP